MSEHRKYQRFAVDIAAEIILDGDHVSAATNDVSKGGIGLVLSRPVPDGAQLNVSLFLREDGIEDPDEEPFETVAKVMWSAPRDDGKYAAGLQFSKLSPASAALLEHFLHKIG